MLIHSLCQRLSAIGPVLLPVLLDAAVKGLIILSLTALAALAMRRASAAARHLIWFLGALSLLILPVLSAALPAWHVLPQWANNVAVTTVPASASSTAVTADVPPSAHDNRVLPNESPMQGEPPVPALSPIRFAWQTWVLFAWLAGSALFLGYVALGFASLGWLQRRSRRLTADGWPTLLRQVCDQLGFSRPVELLSSPRRTMPMTWGIWRTRLLLPEDSNTWSNEQRRTVLLHELAHAKRWDCLTQLVAQLACAVYWFNPLLWLAWKRMQAEREQACDDLVLSAGTKASAYAEQLLYIASDMPAVRFSAAAIAMARPNKLEGRLLAILDVKRNRRNLTRWGVLIAAAAAMALAIPMACMKAAAQEDQSAAQPVPSTNAARSRHFVMLVIAPGGGMTFQGTATNWDTLPALLEQVPDRGHTVLCLAWTNDQVTVGQLNEARAGNLAQQFGFEYLSNVGEHPLGSTGGPDKLIEDVQAAPAGGGAAPKESAAKLHQWVEDFFHHNYRDITDRKTLEWGEPTTTALGNLSIRYKFDAVIWDKEILTMNQVFTFTPDGKFVSVKDVEGFPLKRGIVPPTTRPAVPDDKIEDALHLWVEKFFSRNYRDITARTTIEWGKPQKRPDGNWQIRYKYQATIWDKDQIVYDKFFTFTPTGEFVEVKDAQPPTSQPAAGQAAAKQEPGETITLSVHNGLVRMRMGDKVAEAARIEFDPVGGPRLVAEADGNVVRLLRDGDERNIAGLGVRIEIAPNGQVVAEGGIIRLIQNALDNQGK
jgi:beta-lactamase regulating signal transducer with metallopeptidase domain